MPAAAAGCGPGGAQQQSEPASGTPAAAPAQGDAQQPQPIFRAGVNFVRVDVIVNDNKGEPVTNLTQADFEVLEDGKPQTVEQFRLIRVDGNPRPGDPPPRELRNRIDEEIEISKDDVRLFVFFIDDYHVRLGNSISVKEPLTRFVQTQIRPNDVVGIMYPLTPLDGITFTRNPATMISAIERFEGRKFDYRPRNLFEEQYARAPSEIVEQIRNQVVMTALRGLSSRLGGLREGRKAIIYVSEGLTAMLPPQLRVADASLGPLSNPGGRSSPMTGREQHRARKPRRSSPSRICTRRCATSSPRRTATTRRSTRSIPRGLTPFEFGIDEAVGPNQDRRTLQMTQDTLRSLADETDGRAIVNRNDLLPGLAQIVRDSSFYYLLGYNSTLAPSDGKFHQITVRLKRRGLDVRARKGYWALTAEEIVRANTPTVETAEAGAERAGVDRDVGPGRQVRADVARHVARRAGQDAGHAPVGAAAAVAWPATRPAAAWTRVADRRGYQRRPRVPRPRARDARIVGARLRRRRPAPQRITFDAAPGQLELRMNVEETTGGTLDSEIRTIMVPDLTATEAAISTPRVHRARTVREFQTIAADPAAVPAVAREFSRTERLLIRFDVYGNATPTAVLMNRNGNKMADVPVAASAVAGTHQIDLSLAAIAAGEYVVEITAKGATGEAKELVPLRIGS